MKSANLRASAHLQMTVSIQIADEMTSFFVIKANDILAYRICEIKVFDYSIVEAIFCQRREMTSFTGFCSCRNNIAKL